MPSRTGWSKQYDTSVATNQNSRIHPGRSSSKKIEDDQQHYCPRRPGGQQKIWFRTIFHLTQTQFLSLKHSVKWKVRTSGRHNRRGRTRMEWLQNTRGISVVSLRRGWIRMDVRFLWVPQMSGAFFLLLCLTSTGSGDNGTIHIVRGLGGKSEENMEEEM